MKKLLQIMSRPGNPHREAAWVLLLLRGYIVLGVVAISLFLAGLPIGITTLKVYAIGVGMLGGYRLAYLDKYPKEPR